MHQHNSSRRGRILARAGGLTLSVGVALGAGHLVSGTPAAAQAQTSAAQVAAVAPALVSPRLTAAVGPRAIRWGQAATVSGWLTNARTGAPMGARSALIYWAGKGWKTSGYKMVGAGGKVSYRVWPKRATAYRIIGARTGSKVLWVQVRPTGAQALATAKRHIGAPYRYGASGPRAFDCSGFTQYVYRKVGGIRLPHKANSQQRYGRAIARAHARPGDLIIMRSGGHGYHVGVYAGNGYQIHSPRPGKRVTLSKIWGRNYVVRRLVG